jgi:hypothetical protein
MKKIFFPVLLLAFAAFHIASCKKDNIIWQPPSSQQPPPTTPELRNEMKFENLSWNLWHDTNDPTGTFDEIYIITPRVLRSSFGSVFRVFVKTVPSLDWIEAKTVTNGQLSRPFDYFVHSDRVDSVYILIHSTLQDRSLPGTIASVKINY